MKTQRKVIKMPSAEITFPYLTLHPKQEEEESEKGYATLSWQPMKIGGGW